MGWRRRCGRCMRSAAWGCEGIMPDEATIGEFLIGILPRLQNDTTFPWWPPDCFGLCLALLKRTGAYAQALRDWPPEPKEGALAAWTHTVRKLGEKWQPFESKDYPDDLE